MALARKRSSSPRPPSRRRRDGGANHVGLAAEEEQDTEQKDAIEPHTGEMKVESEEEGNEEAGDENDSNDEEVDGNSSKGSPSDDEQENGEYDQLLGDGTIEDDESSKDNPEGERMKDGRERDSKHPLGKNSSDSRTTNKQNPKAKGKYNKTKDGEGGNPLTKLIPGYTAPRTLNTSSLGKFRPTGGIRELQRRAERTDASTRDFVIGATAGHTNAMRLTPQGFLPKSYTDAYSSFKKGVKRAPDNTAGQGWFGMKPSTMTEELKTDLAVIRNRSYLDPKRFYKSADKHHKIVQVGTVIEGPSEYFSSRLTKKQRRSNITEEIMADPSSADYAKNKFKQMSREKTQKARMRKVKPKRSKKIY